MFTQSPTGHDAMASLQWQARSATHALRLRCRRASPQIARELERELETLELGVENRAQRNRMGSSSCARSFLRLRRDAPCCGVAGAANAARRPQTARDRARSSA